MPYILELTRTGIFATGQTTDPELGYLLGTLQGDFSEGVRGMYRDEEDECDEC